MPDAWGNIAVAPQIISSEVATISGNTITPSANIVYLYAFELYTTTVIVGARYHVGVTAAGNSNMGIYTAAGNLVSGSDTGAAANVSGTTKTFTYSPPITLLPGQYFIAFSCTAGDSIQGVSVSVTDSSRAKRATNVMAAGALPLTTGAIVINPTSIPGMALLVSGGLL